MRQDTAVAPEAMDDPAPLRRNSIPHHAAGCHGTFAGSVRPGRLVEAPDGELGSAAPAQGSVRVRAPRLC
jgi:hypothetical protein